ncbi:alpha/beta hydrolase family protein [Aeromonas allosaccharophila]|nr:alpha/beta hydrolase family protein [Aeromonas allosaccharophila]
MADHTRDIQPNTHGDSDWPKLIPHLRRELKAIGW